MSRTAGIALAIAVAITVALWWAPTARAPCADPETPTRVTPSAVDVAPRNTHVRIWYSPKTLPDVDKVVVRVAGGAPIAVERSADAAYGMHWAELVPKKRLDATTRYEVVLGDAVIGSFTTGTHDDTKGPTLAGIRDASWIRDGHRTNCDGAPWESMTLVLDKVKDGFAGSRSLWVAIWAPGGDDEIDYSKPPLAVILPEPESRGEILLPPFKLRPNEKKLRVGVKVMDSAGNLSHAKDVVLKLEQR